MRNNRVFNRGDCAACRRVNGCGHRAFSLGDELAFQHFVANGNFDFGNIANMLT